MEEREAFSDSVNEGLPKDFYRKAKSVEGSGHFVENPNLLK